MHPRGCNRDMVMTSLCPIFPIRTLNCKPCIPPSRGTTHEGGLHAFFIPGSRLLRRLTIGGYLPSLHSTFIMPISFDVFATRDDDIEAHALIKLLPINYMISPTIGCNTSLGYHWVFLAVVFYRLELHGHSHAYSLFSTYENPSVVRTRRGTDSIRFRLHSDMALQRDALS